MARAGSSLQSRLTVRLLGIFVGAFLLTGLVTYVLSRAGDNELPMDSLLADLDDVVPHIKRGAGGILAVDDTPRTRDVAFILRRADGTELQRGGNREALQSIAGMSAAPSVVGMPPGAYNLTWRFDAKTESHIYLIAEAVEVDGDAVIIEVAEVDTLADSGLYALIYEWLGEFVPIGIPLMLALVLAITFSLRSALKPLQTLRRLAARINPQQTGLRLPTEELPSELQLPVLAINRALDRLDQGFQAQRDFLADAAHELRTPLAILSAHLDTLPRSEGADALKSDVERMARLVNQLLLVAQMESLTINPDETADLAEIALELAALFAPLAIRRKRTVGVSGAEHPVLVRGNRDALYQALRNLVENALRFTAENTEVEIAVEPDGSVSVSDRGPGIPAEEREKLFRRFWQGDRHKSRPKGSDGSAGGAGLGLAIAQRIAETHGGSLRITDNPGGGARFTLVLPAVAVSGLGTHPRRALA